MNLETLITDLKAAGANENTLRLAMNCYELGRSDLRQELYTSLTKMPLNDTAHSIAYWIREQK
jgi:hypothetical protein